MSLERLVSEEHNQVFPCESTVQSTASPNFSFSTHLIHIKEAKGSNLSHILSPHKKCHIPTKAMFKKTNERKKQHICCYPCLK